MKEDISQISEVLEARTKDLIALAHILDKFEEFSKAIKKVMTEVNINDRELGSYILKISKNKFVLSRKIKTFYMDNEVTIKTIMQYSGIVEFICFNYSNSGNVLPTMDFFYQYMVENRDKLDQILTLLEHLNELGFRNVQFNPNLDEDYEECTISRYYQDNFEIIYSDGTQISPTAILGDIKYKIVGGNYVMKLLPGMPSLSRDWMQSSDPIVVKSLLFDVKSLPESLSREAIFDRIRKLSEAQKEKSDKIRQSVHLSVLIDGFSDQYNYGVKVLEMIEDVSTKVELIRILEQIRTQLNEMQIVSMRYDDSITQCSDEITQEQLQKEKRFYLERQSQL